MMQFVYFARVREAIGNDGEEHDLPHDIGSVDDCLTWLEQRGPQYQSAFCDRAKLRFALDQKMARLHDRLDGARELAIFPPVTGG